MGFMAGFGAAAGGAAQGIQSGMQLMLQRQFMQIQKQRANIEGWNQLNQFLNTVDPQTAKTMWPQVAKTFMGADPGDANAKASYMQWIDGNTQSGTALRTALSSMGDPNSPMNSVVKNIPVQTFANIMKNPQALVQFLSATTQYQLQQSALKAMPGIAGIGGPDGSGGTPTGGPSAPAGYPNLPAVNTQGLGFRGNVILPESGGFGNAVKRNADGSAPTDSGYPRSYFQITDGTWRDFAPKVGVNLNQFPNAAYADINTQKQVADTIPLNRWAPSTVASLSRKYPGLDPNMTLGQAAAKYDNSWAPTQYSTGGYGMAAPLPSAVAGTAAPSTPTTPPAQPPTQVAAGPAAPTDASLGPTQGAPAPTPPTPNAPPIAPAPTGGTAAPPPAVTAPAPAVAPSSSGTALPSTATPNVSGGTTTVAAAPPPAAAAPAAPAPPPPQAIISPELQQQVANMRANANRISQAAIQMSVLNPAASQALASRAQILNQQADQIEQRAVNVSQATSQQSQAASRAAEVQIAARKQYIDELIQTGWRPDGPPAPDGSQAMVNMGSGERKMVAGPAVYGNIISTNAKIDADTASNMRTNQMGAKDAMDDIATLRRVDGANLAKEGVGSEFFAEMARIGSKFNIPVGKSIFGTPGYSDLVNQLDTNLLTRMMTQAKVQSSSSMGSAFNPTAHEIQVENVPQLTQTVEGRQLMMDTLEKYYHNQIELGKIVNAHNGLTLSMPDSNGKTAYQKMQDYYLDPVQNPPVSPAINQRIGQATGRIGRTGSGISLPPTASGEPSTYIPPATKPPNTKQPAPPASGQQNITDYSKMSPTEFLQSIAKSKQGQTIGPKAPASLAPVITPPSGL